jgi:phage nucleotide-binding protein
VGWGAILVATIEITSTKDSVMDGLKVLVYGPSGSGKTTLIKTMPNPLIISSERGLLPLAGFDFPVIHIENEADLRKALKYCKSRECEYDSICLDSLTDIAEVVLAEAQGLVKDGRQAYGMLLITMSSFIRDFKKLSGKNVYMTAQEEVKEVNGIDLTRPKMPGQALTSALPYAFDEVFRLSSDRKGVRKLLTEQTATKIAKDRTGKLDKEIDPDLGSVVNLLTLPF